MTPEIEQLNEKDRTLEARTARNTEPAPEAGNASGFSVGDEVNGRVILDADGDNFLIEDANGQLQVVSAQELRRQETQTEKEPTAPSPTEAQPTKSEAEEIMEVIEDEEIDQKRAEDIADKTALAVEEPDTGDPHLDTGERLMNLFTARKNKIEELTRATEPAAIEALDYEEIDNRFYALAVLQMGLKKMALPLETQQKFYAEYLTGLEQPKFAKADFDLLQDKKTKIEELNQRLAGLKMEMERINTATDSKKRWWKAQEAKEEQAIEKIFTAQMEGEDYTDWETLPDRVIIALEDKLENHQPPLRHPLETQEFYLDRKKTAEEFFKKIILDPARFFDRLKEKENTFVIAAARFHHDSHPEQFARAYAQFKLFVNKYVERFNNMLALMGIKERMDYDYNPSYKGRAQDMKNLWAKIHNEYSDKIGEYKERLAQGQTANIDQEQQLEARNLAA